MTYRFAVSFDYRCPFARNAQEAVVTGLREGRDWDVRFLAFSLDQVHVPDDEPPVWDREPDARGSGVLALEWGIAVRDVFSEHFRAAHVALFAARHDHGGKLAEEPVLRDAIASIELDPDAVAAEVASGRPLQTLAAEHKEAVTKWAMFGVPTFAVGDRAVFVRLMERDRPEDVERVLDLFEFERLNELKYTRIPR
ncbi:MAG: DsbA family protein [Acidimicrobiia bacterium]|jgi:DSBA-like thioredoxin domain